jgi:hypothetical protein
MFHPNLNTTRENTAYCRLEQLRETAPSLDESNPAWLNKFKQTNPEAMWNFSNTAHMLGVTRMAYSPRLWLMAIGW